MCVDSSALSNLRIFFSWGEATSSGNRDAVSGSWDSFCMEPSAGLYIRRKLFPHVFPRGNELRSLLDQGIRAPGILVGYVARNGVDVAVLFEGAAGSDARAAVFRGFDHQYAGGRAADDPVADGNVLWSRESSDRELRDQRATDSHDLLGEPRVFLGVHDVNSGAEDGD